MPRGKVTGSMELCPRNHSSPPFPSGKMFHPSGCLDVLLILPELSGDLFVPSRICRAETLGLLAPSRAVLALTPSLVTVWVPPAGKRMALGAFPAVLGSGPQTPAAFWWHLRAPAC